MSAPHPAVETSIQVRYAETDAQRVVYHGNYIIWFEVARTTYCERAGYPYPRMEAEGSFITVTEARNLLPGAWWCIVPPALALFFLVWTARRLGDAFLGRRGDVQSRLA
ncbi:MAG TPA: hypothetical protein VHP60_01115 [Thermoanaerobaculia bacterium]|nr:hypothetical protein [Thermoanaerobaculia bacterium]